MGILKDFRRAVDALERVAASISAAARAQTDNSQLSERLSDLERGRTMWEADVEGLLQKAEGKLRAAANAEARERTMQKFNEDELDPFGEDSDEIQERVPEEDVEPSYPEEVQPLPVGMEAESRKAYALRMKYS